MDAAKMMRWLFMLVVAGLIIETVPSALAAPEASQRRQPPASQRDLNETDVASLLRAHVAPAEVGARARRQGIDFVLTAPVQQELKSAGADSELLQTLRQIQPRGLVWGPARLVAKSAHGVYDESNLVTEGGKHYLAFTGDDKRVRLASDASGAWRVYDAYLDSDVGNGSNQWYVGLVVHSGAVYIPFVSFVGGKNIVGVAYNGSRNLQGAWARAAIFSTDASYLNDPFGTLAGNSLLVSFDTPGPSPKTSDDVFVASIPLSGLPAGGASLASPLPAQITNVSKVDDVQGGPADDYAEIVAEADGLNLAWQRGLKTLVLARGQSGGRSGAIWPPEPQLLHTASDQAQQSLQLAVKGQAVLVARFIENPDRNSALGEMDVWATTNAGGSWSTQTVGRTNLALQKPGAAISACGPSVAFFQASSGNSGRLAVATFAGGHWASQRLSADAAQPRLAATAEGLDMTYLSGPYGDIYFQQAKCYPPPAPQP